MNIDISFINKTKARLGSVPKSKIETMPKSVQKLLNEDMPSLIDLVDILLKEREKNEI
jgi:hypothetical protein